MTARETPGWKSGPWAAIVLVLAGALVSGCASGGAGSPPPQYLAASPEHSAQAANPADPMEKSNRNTLESNRVFNEQVIYPISDAYHDTVPEPVRNSIGNFTSNLSEPAIFANDILQLRFKAAAVTTGRFLMNSTVGIGGLFDVASDQSLPKQSGDFGQTLYVWGVKDSPYLVLPILGPTNVRDAVGNGIELAATSVPAGGLMGAKIANTVNNVSNVGTALTPFSSLDKVDDLRELEKGSLDFYAMLKSVVEQKRDAELKQAVSESAFYLPQETSETGIATASVTSSSTTQAALPWLATVETADGRTISAGQSGKIVIAPDSAPSPSGKIVIGPERAPSPGGKIVIGPDTAPSPTGKIVIGPESVAR